jgi:crotonobetaine/carnitine-CoA ligase
MAGDAVTDGGFVRALLAIARAHPERVYARFEGAPMTFGALDTMSAALAAQLRRGGVAAGDRVAVMMDNSPAALATIAALARSRAVWVPINTRQRGEGLRYILEHAEPAMVIADDVHRETIEASGASRVRFGDIATTLPSPIRFDETEVAGDGLVAGDDLLAIMYTSGTTGPPKGVCVTHRMLGFAGEGVALASDAAAGDVLFMWEPFFHIGGAQMLVLPLMGDVTLAVAPRFSASRFWDQVRAARATHIHYLGGILQILLKQPASDLDRRHRVRIAWGGGCPVETWRAFEERFGVRVRECYGMTEASSITTYNDAGVVGAIGRPVPWLEVDVVDARGRSASAGVRGEIVVRARQAGPLSAGYFRDPAATARALRDGALHTGDLGSRDANGLFYFHGRLTDSIRCRGENVSAWEIERVVAAHPAVEECAVIGVAAEVGEQEIKLFVKPKADAGIDPRALTEWLTERVAAYQVPRYVAVVDDFPRTPSLRIVKRELSAATDACFDRLAGTTPARRSGSSGG